MNINIGRQIENKNNTTNWITRQSSKYVEIKFPLGFQDTKINPNPFSGCRARMRKPLLSIFERSAIDFYRYLKQWLIRDLVSSAFVLFTSFEKKKKAMFHIKRKRDDHFFFWKRGCTKNSTTNKITKMWSSCASGCVSKWNSLTHTPCCLAAGK